MGDTRNVEKEKNFDFVVQMSNLRICRAHDIVTHFSLRNLLTF